MTYSKQRVVKFIRFDDTTGASLAIRSRLCDRTESVEADFGTNTPTLPPGKKVKKRFVLQALAKSESLLPAHPWNCGYRTWRTWGKRFHLRKSAEQALNSARNQHGDRLYFRVVEAS